MGISNLKAGGSRRPFTPRTCHVFGQVVGYEMKDPKGVKSDASDAVIVALFSPAGAVMPEQADDGTLLTHVKVVLNEPAGPSETTTILDLKKGKNNMKASKAGDFVMLKDCELKNGVYHARRAEGAVREFNPTTHMPFNGMMRVMPEYSKDGSEYTKMNRFAILPLDAKAFVGLEGLAAAAEEAMTIAGQYHGADAMVLLRGLELDADGKYVDAVTSEIWAAWDNEAKTSLSPKESVAKWIADPRNSKLVAAISNGDAVNEEGTSYHWEAIPQFKVNTGKMSKPSQKLAGIRKEKREPTEQEARRADTSLNYRVPDPNGRNGIAQGFVESNAILSRKQHDDGTWAATHTIYTEHARPFAPRFRTAEIITVNTPEHIAELFQKKADDNSREMNSKKPAPEASAPAETAEQDTAPAYGMGG